MTAHFHGRTFALVTLAAAALAVSGCVGIGFMHPMETRFQHFGTDKINGKKNLAAYIRKDGNPSKEDVQAAWGKPNVIFRHDKLEVWQYHNGMNWYGVIPMIGIPIPLVLPITRSKIDIYFLGDAAQYATAQSTTWSGFCFCPNSEADMRYGFHALQP